MSEIPNQPASKERRNNARSSGLAMFAENYRGPELDPDQVMEATEIIADLGEIALRMRQHPAFEGFFASIAFTTDTEQRNVVDISFI